MFAHSRRALGTLIALSILLMLTSAGCSANRWRLRLDVDTGQEFRFAIDQNQDFNMNIGAMGSQQGSTRSRLEMSQTVSSRDQVGNVVLDTVYSRMVIELDMMGQAMNFDTEAPAQEGADNPLAPLKDVLIGKPIQIRMSPRAEILSIEGFDAIWDDAIESAVDDPVTLELLESLKKDFGAESLRAQFEQMAVGFPDAPVGPGDGWERDATLNNAMVGEIAMHSAFVVVGAEEHGGIACVKLDFDSTLDFGGDLPLAQQMAESFRAQGTEASVDIEVGQAIGSGSLWIETATGMPAGMQMTQNMSMKMDFRLVQAGQEMPMGIDVELEQKMSLQRVD